MKRVKLSFDRYLKGDSNGKRSGKPRLKEQGRYCSFAYPQASIDWIDGKFIELSKIGAINVIWHCPLPNGFSVKTAIITNKADGWYATNAARNIKQRAVEHPVQAHLGDQNAEPEER